jgi:hypothetical protein
VAEVLCSSVGEELRTSTRPEDELVFGIEALVRQLAN